MLPCTLFVAALTAVCTDVAWCAVPFAVNHTELRRTHQLRNTNSVRPSWGRRRARDTVHLITQPQLGTSSEHGTPSPYVSAPPLSSPFWANDSLVGLQVECTDAAKSCLSINRLLHEPSGRCYELGDTRPCGIDGSTLVLDSEAFRQGRLRSRCMQRDSCNAFSMAFDGKCYESWDIFGKYCNGTKGVVYHPFGGLECEKQKEISVKKVPVIRQPSARGKCVMPNFHDVEMGPFMVKCSSKDAECLGKGLLPFREGCYDPLSNSTCPDGLWLIMDERAAENGHLRVTCMPALPCGPDALLLRADGTCHASKELFLKLCYGYNVVFLPTGDVACTLKGNRYKVLGSMTEKSMCEIHMIPAKVQTADGAISVGGVRCVRNDDDVCQPDVVSLAPKPDILPEE